ncbi:MAG TPA: hypothetical protein VGK67_20500 [Myxococcales bacterium]|jgi:hypothetical protein
MPSASLCLLPLLFALAAPGDPAAVAADPPAATAAQVPAAVPGPAPVPAAAAEEPPAKGPVAQYNASFLLLGMGGHDRRGWSGGAQVALRPELILGRKDGSSFGGGPYLEAGAHLASRGVAGLFGLGASLLVPLGNANALVPSVGGYGTYSQELGFQPGLSAGLFLGARLFNDRTYFDGAWGLRLDVRYGLGSAHEAMATLGLQVDLSLAAFLLSWIVQ